MDENPPVNGNGGGPAPLCGAQTRSGNPCKRFAGAGTSHIGFGRCKHHGGNAPSGNTAGQREAAMAYAAEALHMGGDTDPLTASLASVRHAGGIRDYYARRLEADEHDTDLMALYAKAVERVGRMAKMAVDAGVAEAHVRIAERWQEMITLAAEEALASLDLSPEQRTVFAGAFGRGLARLEEGVVDSTAREVG